jgi:acyl carrier protein
VADSIESQVIDIIAKRRKINPSIVTLESTFEQLGIDSLEAADLVFTFEDTFGIVVPDEAAQSMKTVRQVVDGVRRLTAERTGA